MKVIVTGASDGIGRLIVEKFERNGAQVIATARKKNVEGFNKNVFYLQADQTEPELATQKIVEATKKLGWEKCDCLILNASVGKVGNPMEENVEDIVEQVNVNLMATILIAQALAPLLMNANGTLALIGSVAHKGNKNFATYAATKAGVHSLARSLEQEWEGKVKVQVIHPAAIKTNMHKKAGAEIGWVKKFFAPPDKMANVIVKTLNKKSGVYRISTLKAWMSKGEIK